MPLSTFLNGGTAIQLRGLAWLALSDFGEVGRGTFISDGGGGGTQTWAYSSGTVPCSVDPFGTGGQDEVLVADRLDDRSTHIITTPAGTNVTRADRFRVLGRGTYEVTAVRTATAEWDKTFEAVQVS
jgi:hypothetical protein